MSSKTALKPRTNAHFNYPISPNAMNINQVNMSMNQQQQVQFY